MIKKKYITVFLIIVSILAIAFFVRDWYVFFQCGPVDQCIEDASHFQNYAKFAVTAIVTVIAFFIGKNCLCVRDRRLLQVGFVMVFCADFCLKILHMTNLFNHRDDYVLLGICFFMVVQALFIFRHSRISDTDNSVPWIILVPFAVMFIANALHLFSVFSSATVPIVATYGAFLICSVIVACQAPKKGYFPAVNARNIKRGMILFFCCDACVGLSLATGEPYTIRETVAAVANNFIWYFYTPALILLALSGYKRSES